MSGSMFLLRLMAVAAVVAAVAAVVMSLQRNSWDTNRGGFCDERTVDNGQNIWK